MGESASQRVGERASGRPVAWLSLDEGDNDLVRFLAYLVGALQKVDKAIGQSVQGLLQSPQLPPAAHHLEKGLALARQASYSEAVISGYLVQAQFAMASGDLARAEVLLDQAGELVQPYRTASRFYTSWMAIRAELYLAQDDTDAAAQCVVACDLQATELTPQDLTAGACWARLPEYLLLPRVLLTQGRLDEAVDVLERLVTVAETGRYLAVLIEATILQALAWHLKRNSVRALEYLERALALAAPEGYVRSFLDAGEPMRRLLRQAVSRGIAPDYVAKLLTAFGAEVQNRAGTASPATARGGSLQHRSGR
jgi:LuxR family maltose regulon positive regulatory protein